MKKVISILLIVALVFSFAACGGGTGEGQGEKMVGFVTDIGGIDDKSFNQSTWEGIKRFADEQGWTEGVEYKYLQSDKDADYVPNITALAEEGYKLIICAGFLFEPTVKDLAPKYPDTMFTIIDAVVEGDNVQSAVFNANEGSFLVGAAAALSSKTGTIGFIGGMESELIVAFEAGFIAGAKAAVPDIKIESQYAGSFADPGKGQIIANSMYDAGADVIYHAAGGTGSGLINVAKERKEAGEDVWACGVDRDQYEDGIIQDGSSVILTSMLKRVDVAAYSAAEAITAGTFPGGELKSYTIVDDGVGIPAENPNLSDDVIDQVMDLKDKIVSGEIVVPTTVE